MTSRLPQRRTTNAEAVRIDSSNERTAATNQVQQSLVRHRHPLNSFLISLGAHVALLLFLLLVVMGHQPDLVISLQASFVSDPNVDDTGQAVELAVKIEIPAESETPIEQQAEAIALDETPEIKLAENPLAVLESAIESAAPVASAREAPAPPAKTLPTGGGLSGRDANTRAQLAATRGGSPASESAVAQGLSWILRHQLDDGSWRLHHHHGDCNGRCPNEGSGESTTAATGLALMALLGAGYTHRAGPYQEPIQKGLDYLVSKIRYTSYGGIVSEGQKRMYSQAIATIALAEAYNMTRDTQLAGPVEACRAYIVKAQHAGGSWGYNAGSRGDVTVTGWQLMALKSCQMAGLPTEAKTWDQAREFLDSLAGSDASFGYRNESDGNDTTAAIGLLCNMVLGMHKEHSLLEMGATRLGDAGPSETNVYYDYYATQVLHYFGGPKWTVWNQKMRDYLVATQVQGKTHAAGSWYFPDPNNAVGGRLYTTAMSVMILEVYYRYLPLYRDKTFEAGIEIDKNVFR